MVNDSIIDELVAEHKRIGRTDDEPLSGFEEKHIRAMLEVAFDAGYNQGIEEGYYSCVENLNNDS